MICTKFSVIQALNRMFMIVLMKWFLIIKSLENFRMIEYAICLLILTECLYQQLLSSLLA